MPASQVEIVITDVDGVLTDGGICLDARGEELKRFCVYDGLAVKLLERSGITVAFLSSRDSAIVRHRAEDLGVRLHFSGIEHKRPRLEAILAERRIPAERACYVGDDLVDLPCFRLVGFPVAVANAREELRREAKYVTQASGGNGAFREVAELILKARGLWGPLVESFR